MTRPYRDPDHPGNAIRPDASCLGCRQMGCTTAWGDWCFACNVERMDRIDRSLSEIARSFEAHTEK